MSIAPLKYFVVLFCERMIPIMREYDRPTFEKCAREEGVTIKTKNKEGIERNYLIVEKKFFQHGNNSYLIATVEKIK